MIGPDFPAGLVLVLYVDEKGTAHVVSLWCRYLWWAMENFLTGEIVLPSRMRN